MMSRMNAEDLAKDVTEAENLLQMHHERKVSTFLHSCCHGIRLKLTEVMDFMKNRAFVESDEF